MAKPSSAPGTAIGSGVTAAVIAGPCGSGKGGARKGKAGVLITGVGGGGSMVLILDRASMVSNKLGPREPRGPDSFIGGQATWRRTQQICCKSRRIILEDG